MNSPSDILNYLRGIDSSFYKVYTKITNSKDSHNIEIKNSRISPLVVLPFYTLPLFSQLYKLSLVFAQEHGTLKPHSFIHSFIPLASLHLHSFINSLMSFAVYHMRKESPPKQIISHDQ